MMRVILDRWMETNMREGKKGGSAYFFAHWHSTAQTCRQPDDFSHEGLEGEILLQHDPSQDGFQLWNTRTWRRIKGFCLCEGEGWQRRRQDWPQKGSFTDGLWRDEVAEERGEHHQDHGVRDPG